MRIWSRLLILAFYLLANGSFSPLPGQCRRLPPGCGTQSAGERVADENALHQPKNLEDCFVQLKSLLVPELVKRMEDGSEEDMILYHPSVGLQLRNRWGLWRDSPLAAWFRERGVHHPDSMSGIVLTSFWRHLHGLPLELDEQTRECLWDYLKYRQQERQEAGRSEAKELAAEQAWEAACDRSLQSPDPAWFWIRLSRSRDEHLRYRATLVLSEWAKADPRIPPAMEKRISDSNKDTRELAIRYLGRLKPVRMNLIPVFLRWRESGSVEESSPCDEVAYALADMLPESREALTLALGSPDSRQRSRAIKTVNFAIRQREVTATVSLLPGILGCLQDTDEHIRQEAVDTLGKMGPSAAPAVPALVALLSRCEGYDRVRVLKALGASGPAAADAVPVLIPLLSDKNNQPGNDLHEALGGMIPASLPPLRACAEDRRGEVREAVADCLAHCRDDSSLPEVVSLLSTLLGDEQSDVRKAAAFALAKLGKKASAAAPALLGALRDPAPWVRSGSIFALRFMDAVPPEAVPILKDILSGGDDSVGRFAVMNLFYLDPASLAEALGGDNPAAFVRTSEWVRNTGAFGGDLTPLVPALLHRLRSPDALVRVRAAQVLERVWPHRREVGVALAGALNDSDPAVRAAVYPALRRMGTNCGPAPAALRTRLEMPGLQSAEQQEIVQTLLELCPSSAAEVNAILRGPDPLIAECVAVTLADQIDSWVISAGKVVPGLLDLLKSERPILRDAAARALAGLGHCSLRPLARILVSGDAREKTGALQALAGIASRVGGSPLLELVPEIVHLSGDSSSAIRLESVRTLSRIGSIDPRVTEVLKQAQHDPDPRVRSLALCCEGGRLDARPTENE